MPQAPFPGAPIPLAGGRQGKLPVTAFEAFDLEACTWTRHPSLPSRRAFAGCAMAEGSVFSLGGLQQPGPHNFYSRPHFVNTVEMFDLEHGEQWLSWAVVPLSMGWRGTVSRARSDLPYPAGSWTKLPRGLRMRDKRADFVVGSLGGHVVAIGGLGESAGLGMGGEPETGRSSLQHEHHLLPFSRLSRAWGFVSSPFPLCKQARCGQHGPDLGVSLST